MSEVPSEVLSSTVLSSILLHTGCHVSFGVKKESCTNQLCVEEEVVFDQPSQLKGILQMCHKNMLLLQLRKDPVVHV